MWRPKWLRLNTAIVIATFAVLSALSFLSEHIPNNGGLGYDGRDYGQIIQQLDDFPKVRIRPKHAGRLLPAAAMHGMLRAVGADLNRRNIILGFQLYNLLLLTGCAALWTLIADRLELSSRRKILAFVCFFGSFVVLKFQLWYPVLTDQTALLLSTAMLYGYLSGRPWLVLLTTVLGAFTWPTLLFQGALLFALPKRKVAVEPGGFIMPTLWAGLCACGVLAGIYVTSDGFARFRKALQMLVPLSVFVVVLYYVVVVRLLMGARDYYRVFTIIKEVKWLRAAIAVALIIGVGYAKTRLQTVPEKASLLGMYSERLFRESVQRPAEFLVAHAQFFGIVVALAMVNIRRLVRTVQGHGFGLVLVFLMYLAVAVAPTSRQLTAFFPLFVAFTVASLDDELITPRFVAWAAVVALFVSRVWLLMSVNWPKVYFACMGRYFSNEMYVVYLLGTGLSLVVGGAYFEYARRQRALSSSPTSA